MAKVEYVTVTISGTFQDIVYTRCKMFSGAEEQGGVEVALDGFLDAQLLPCLVQRCTPVYADHVSAGGSHLFEHVRSTQSKVNVRRAWIKRGKESLHMGQDECFVIGRG